jgi:hypothetical protein
VISNACEVVNLESSAAICKNPSNMLAFVAFAIGGLGYQNFPVICGGEQNGTLSNKCYTLKNNEWVFSNSMNSVRAYAASAQLDGSKLLVTGGSSGTFLNSTEMLTDQGWETKIPFLPVNIVNHCMVTVNSTTVMVIGGWQNYQYSVKTFYLTIGDQNWTQGPDSKISRRLHSCGRIRRDNFSQEMTIIVAGGYHDGVSPILSSVEILNKSSNEWQSGPELPFNIDLSQMIEDQKGGVVLVGGRSSLYDKLDTLYQLPHGGQDAVWTKMEQKLKTGRDYHTAFLVPDNIVDCS